MPWSELEDTEIDLVILDLQMPGVDGIEVLRKIKERKPLIEVIMLTGHATVETAIDGMKLGAFDFLAQADRDGGAGGEDQPGVRPEGGAGPANPGSGNRRDRETARLVAPFPPRRQEETFE